MTRLCMLAGRLSAPALSATWAAEGTLPPALLLLLFGGRLTWLAVTAAGGGRGSPCCG